MSAEVTAENVTDEQIRQLGADLDWEMCSVHIALNKKLTTDGGKKLAAEHRARCAALINARAKESR